MSKEIKLPKIDLENKRQVTDLQNNLCKMSIKKCDTKCEDCALGFRNLDHFKSIINYKFNQ
jgi:GGDEF domain-containing protein